MDIKKHAKTSPGPNTDFLGLESEKSGNQVPNFENFEKYEKNAPKKTVQNGSYTSPNELTRVRNNEKPIWVEIQKHCKNAVTISMGLQLFQLKAILHGTFWKWTWAY